MMIYDTERYPCGASILTVAIQTESSNLVNTFLLRPGFLVTNAERHSLPVRIVDQRIDNYFAAVSARLWVW